MVKFNSLEELLVNELQSIYHMETQIIEALPKIQNAASSPELKEAFKKHLAETKQHVKRMETALRNLQTKPGDIPSVGIEGLISECNGVIKNQATAVLKDAALIGAVQKIEHYEISAYGTAKAHAKMLNLNEIVDLLKDSDEEEANFDKKLTKIAEGTMFTSGINKQAAR